jgi:hypothetical protein
MSDERLIRKLEEQLRDAHANNAGLRERLAEVDQREATARSLEAEANVKIRQLEQAHARQKAAESAAAAEQRKCSEAERNVLRANARVEELEARVRHLQAEVSRLHALDDRIAAAQHSADLLRSRTTKPALRRAWPSPSEERSSQGVLPTR